MTSLRTLRLAAAALLTGVAGFAASQLPAGAIPAAGQPTATASASGAESLTLGDGTRVALIPPWAALAGHKDTTSQIRSFTSASAHFVCVSEDLETAGPRSAPALPKVPRYTLTVKGSGLAGPANISDQLQVFSATSPIWNANNLPSLPFRHGLVTLHVPAGKYWLIGLFIGGHSLRMDIPAQVTVTGNTTAAVSARAAGSEATAATPRRSVLADAWFVSTYKFRDGWTSEDCGTNDGSRLWVSPLARARTTGTLYSATSAQLNSPPGQAGPYTYELDSPAPAGTIASQHLTVTAADLATVHERFHSDTATTAPWVPLGGPARQANEAGYAALSTNLPMPGDRTVYFQAQPAAVWQQEIAGPLAQTADWQPLHAGQQQNTNWNAYPLHPGPNLPPAGVAQPTRVSAARDGNKLLLDITPFSDSTPGHTGSGLTVFNLIRGHGSYAIYANGVEIAGGPVNTQFPFPDVQAAATLGPKPSQIKFTLNTTRQEPGSNLSGTSEDTWTWPSQAEPDATMTAPWYCQLAVSHGRIVYERHCAVQDMMTLDYRLTREALDGSTPAGPQSLDIAVNHLPRFTPYPVTRAQLEVSFDNGTTWQPATLARICHRQVCTNQFQAGYAAPAGAMVSLRVTARDTRGATVTETILGAYQTA